MTNRDEWLLVAGARAGPVDAIAAYNALLAEALRDAGISAQAVSLAPPGGSSHTGFMSLSPRLQAADVVVLQYNPYGFGRRGLSPSLVSDIRRLQRRTRRPKLILMCHERYVPLRGWKWTAIGLLQRLQLAALLRSADAVVVSTGVWRDSLEALGNKPVIHVPVGSNLPDRRYNRGLM